MARVVMLRTTTPESTPAHDESRGPFEQDPVLSALLDGIQELIEASGFCLTELVIRGIDPYDNDGTARLAEAYKVVAPLLLRTGVGGEPPLVTSAWVKSTDQHSAVA